MGEKTVRDELPSMAWGIVPLLPPCVWEEAITECGWGEEEGTAQGEFTAFQSPFIVLIQSSIRHRTIPPH